jgi:hypothetical protein
VSVRLPIPRTPEALLALASCLDVFWSAVLASGGVKPSLKEECALHERESEAGRKAS